MNTTIVTPKPIVLLPQEMETEPWNDKWHWFQTPPFVISYPKVDPLKWVTTKRGLRQWEFNALFRLGEQCVELQKAVEASIYREFKTTNRAMIPELKNMPFADQGKKAFKFVNGKRIAQPGYTPGALMCTFRMNKDKWDPKENKWVDTGRVPGLVKRVGVGPEAKYVPVVDPQKEFYGGALCVALVRFYHYYIKEEGARGVRAEFKHVAKLRDGVSLGAPQLRPEEAFAPVDLEDDDAEFEHGVPRIDAGDDGADQDEMYG